MMALIGEAMVECYTLTMFTSSAELCIMLHRCTIIKKG